MTLVLMLDGLVATSSPHKTMLLQLLLLPELLMSLPGKVRTCKNIGIAPTECSHGPTLMDQIFWWMTVVTPLSLSMRELSSREPSPRQENFPTQIYSKTKNTKKSLNSSYNQSKTKIIKNGQRSLQDLSEYLKRPLLESTDLFKWPKKENC